MAAHTQATFSLQVQRLLHAHKLLPIQSVKAESPARKTCTMPPSNNRQPPGPVFYAHGSSWTLDPFEDGWKRDLQDAVLTGCWPLRDRQMPHIIKAGFIAEGNALWQTLRKGDGGGSGGSTWNEPGRDLMHAVERSGQCEEDTRNQVEVIHEPELQSRYTVGTEVQ